MSEAASELGEADLQRKTPELSFWPYSDKPEWEFRCSGLGAKVEPSRLEKKAWTTEGRELYIPQGMLVGRVDFLPYKDNKVYLPGTRKQAVLAGVHALQQFFDHIGKIDPQYPDQPMPEPKYLMGITNEQFAKFIKRVGFKQIKHITGWEGFDSKKSDEIAVIAETSTVREQFDELKKAHSWIEEAIQ